MKTPQRKKAMEVAYKKLRLAIQAADSACADLEIEAGTAIRENNVPPPWRVRSIAMNVRRSVELASALAIDLPPAINEVKS